MPPVDECCVLIPASTLEDFPAKLSDDDARSLLAGWTVLWHPRLLVQTGQSPDWHRHDVPPDLAASPQGELRRLILAPTPSLDGLPAGYAQRAADDPNCWWITGGDRAEMAAAIGLEPCQSLESSDGARTIGVEDFYAAAFASLQIQIMTRRLRYTSNLDEIHLQGRVVESARAFIGGDADAAIAAMHEVFDSLAEERDHYFTSDPHLIDLTLVTGSTVGRLLETWSDSPAPKPESSVLATPGCLLVPIDAARALAGSEDQKAADILGQMADGRIGWAGGGPGDEVCLDVMTLSQAQRALREAHAETTSLVGAAPPVYGRFSGSTPTDMTPTIAALGYLGMTPIDFAGGTGYGDEAKVMMPAGETEIEALTARPIDAASDASFLTLGAKLGEAIDSGEIATALLVHWPGQSCDSLDDLRRVASWSVSLGRFWKLDDYFRDGEHPYHHGGQSAAGAAASELLASRVAGGSPDPISSLAETFCSAARSERDELVAGMAKLVKPDSPQTVSPQTNSPKPNSVQDSSAKQGQANAGADFARSIGARPGQSGKSRVIINPHSTGVRQAVSMSDPVAAADHIFAAHRISGANVCHVDVPAGGFVTLSPNRSGKPDAGTKTSLGKWLRKKWLGTRTSIAEGGRFQNEFLEATVSPESGGISGVYSGAARGNRFSVRLVTVGIDGKSDKEATKMVADKIRVAESTSAIGRIEVTGRITDEADVVVARFTTAYTVRRGSRVIEMTGTVTAQAGAKFGDDPWRSYIAARVAVASDASICRVILRDKLHRASSRRLVAPLGFLIDEADRQTLVATHGQAFHRRVDSRFFDSLVMVAGQTPVPFRFDYGFDVPAPVATAKSRIAPPVEVPADDADGKVPPIGWIVHTSPKDLLLTDLRIARRDDGHLAGLVRVVQTRPKSSTASVRFFRDVESAATISIGDENEAINRDFPADDPARLESDGDRVVVPMASHGVADILVVFKST